MKRLLPISLLLAFTLSACIHESADVNTTAYTGGSVNPAWPSDSARASSISSGTRPAGQAKKADTVPKGFTLPNLIDTSQRKKF